MEPNSEKRFGGCSFELEICYVPIMAPTLVSDTSTTTKSILKNGIFYNENYLSSNPSTPVKMLNDGNSSPLIPAPSIPPSRIGIRRKRLKGDSWCYKKVCEEVLALTATDLRQTAESVV